MGTPFLEQYETHRGACPRTPRPYRIREAVNMKLLEAERALVKIPALMMDGRTRRGGRGVGQCPRESDMVSVPLMPARSMAMM